MNEGLLTDREIAALVVFGSLMVGLVVLAVRKEQLRRSFGAVLRALVRPQIALVFLWYFACLSASLIGASRLGVWEWSLWKPTVVWLVLGGIGLLFKHHEAIKQRGFGWQVSLRTIALVEIVSFVADLASFPLWVEIPAQGLGLIAGALVAWTSNRPEHAPAAKLANGYLVLFGVSALLAGVRRAVADWPDLDHGLLLREFFVPIWLTPVALVGVYGFAIFCVYETAFVQMTRAANGRSLFKQRLAVVLRTAGRVGRLRALRRAGGWRFARANGFREAWAEVGEVIRQGPE